MSTTLKSSLLCFIAVVGIVAAAVTIVVVAVPEGFPFAVTMILAYLGKRKMGDPAMVRKLSACETVSSATAICTDKTGTLQVTKVWVGQESMEDGGGSISPFVVELIHQGVALNTTAGSPLTEYEKAINSWAVVELKMDMEKIKKSCRVLIRVEALDFEQKRSGVLIGRNNDDTVHVHWKGDAEMVLAMCSTYHDACGVVKDIDDGERAKFEQIIQGTAASNLRCIAFAHKQVPEEEYDELKAMERVDGRSLTLLGLVGIKDPCRTVIC
ncbi:hypothetical protein Golob_016026 [Gossypium lobatum]|uniref:Uncharacterized protein n=1 Tax=Gossypium lobatum TaxID=34289 RepID=A0A7J8M2X9_9ROSI|nr:hypothetical protein [Gossypium lobatum]